MVDEKTSHGHIDFEFEIVNRIFGGFMDFKKIFSCGCLSNGSSAAAGDDAQKNVAAKKGADSSNRSVTVLVVLSAIAAAVTAFALSVLFIPAVAAFAAPLTSFLAALVAKTGLVIPGYVFPAVTGTIALATALAAVALHKPKASAAAAA